MPAPSPTRLPIATTSQLPQVGAYNALSVQTLAAGQSYLDPTTQVRIYKLTSATFPDPAGNTAGWRHDYSEGTYEMSLPQPDGTRTFLVSSLAPPFDYWLFDGNINTGLTNARKLTGTNFQPWMDIAFTFSNNPATPTWAYVVQLVGGNVGTVRRFDTKTMTEITGNGFPITDGAIVVESDGQTRYNFPAWLQQSQNDGLFVWMRGPTHAASVTVETVGYEPSTGTLKVTSTINCNEPHLDRAGRYVMIVDNNNGMIIWDWQANIQTWSMVGDSGTPPPLANAPFGHAASLNRRVLNVQINQPFPPPLFQIDPAVPNSTEILSGGTSSGTPSHSCGTWLQSPTDLNDQWVLLSMYGSLQTLPPFDTVAWLCPGHMMLVAANGQRRVLAHPYNTSSVYERLPFGKLSPDGNYVLFDSDMNGQARTDVFLAELPVIQPTSVYNFAFTDNATDETGFEIEKSIDGAPFTLLQTLGPNITTFSDSPLVAPHDYRYRVRAIKTGTTPSGYTNIVDINLSIAIPGRISRMSGRRWR